MLMTQHLLFVGFGLTDHSKNASTTCIGHCPGEMDDKLGVGTALMLAKDPYRSVCSSW